MLKKTITQLFILTIVISCIFLANGLILAWTSPGSNPPGSNVSPPINTSVTAQTKSGSLLSSSDIRAPIFYDQNNTGYYVDPASTSRLNYGVYDNLYSYGWMQSPIFYDANNTGYYVDPAGTSKFNTINLGGVSKSEWPSGGGTASRGSCVYVSAQFAAICPTDYFLVEMDRSSCSHVYTSGDCWAKCCKIRID